MDPRGAAPDFYRFGRRRDAHRIDLSGDLGRIDETLDDIERATFTSRLHQLVERFALGPLLDQSANRLSLGQRMRCELAACLLHDPEVVFLDEPTIGLDLLARRRFRHLLVRLNDERATTIFLTSHDIADVEAVAQRVVVMNHGRVVHDDSVAAMRRTLLSTKLVEVGLAAPVAAPSVFRA